MESTIWNDGGNLRMLKKYNILKNGRVQFVTVTDFNSAKIGLTNAFGKIPNRNQILKIMELAIGSKMTMFGFSIVVRSQNKSWKEMRDEA